jgi:hypothetical protein
MVGSSPMHSLRDFKAKLRRMPEVAFSDIGRIQKCLNPFFLTPMS